MLLSRFVFVPLLALLAGAEPAAAQVTVNGAGASFPAPVYALWLKAYRASHSGVNIAYDAVGSGGGIRAVLESRLDFGASDGPMSDKQLQKYQEAHGFGILHFATVLGAAVPAYNLPGSPELNFTPESLAGIYLGRITRWDDPLLREANPQAKLPSAAIVVLHRSEGSGTTYVWSEYLSKVSEVWKSKIGTGFSVNWPAGLGARGNEGMSDLISKTANSLGYVELSYALQNHLNFGRVRNASGAFVKADLASVSAAASDAAPRGAGDFRFSITNAPAKNAFPIASFSWLLVPAKIADPNKKKAIVDFLTWALTDGQNLSGQLAYARVPSAIATQELAAVSRIQ